MKVLYLYSGTRKNRFKGQIGVDYPDTQFYGLNHLKKFGIEAEYKELEDLVKSSFLRSILGWRFGHFLMYFEARKYDVVFGISIIYLMFWKKILPTKTKFVLFNSVIRRTLLANKDKKIKLAIIKWLLKELDAVVCLSNFQKEYIEAEIPSLKGKTYYVPLGVDTTFHKSIDDKREFYLSIGRDNGRDYQTVIDVARELPRKDFRIVSLPRNIENLKDIPNNVKFFHNLSFKDLEKEFQKAKAMLLITHTDDVLLGSADASGPTVLLDSMARGVPVIASRKEYLKDYVVDGQEALLVDFYCPKCIISAIDRIEKDHDLASLLAKNARKKAVEEFSTYKMAKNLSIIFKEVYESN